MPEPTPSQSRTPKTMSSRLMTMKFMQRAAADTPPTPQSQAQATELPPSKGQKTSNLPIYSCATTSTTDLQLVQTILDEEQKRIRAIEMLAEDAGETKWVLSTVDGELDTDNRNLRVTRAGYSEIDEGSWRSATAGRRSFGKFNRESEQLPSSSEESSEADNSRNEDDEYIDGPNSGEVSIEEAIKHVNAERLELKRQRKAEKAELARLAEPRRKKEVKLSRLSSISGVSGSGSKPGGGKGDRECYLCGERGHERRDCPQQGRRPRNRSPSDGAIERSKRHKPLLH